MRNLGLMTVCLPILAHVVSTVISYQPEHPAADAMGFMLD